MGNDLKTKIFIQNGVINGVLTSGEQYKEIHRRNNTYLHFCHNLKLKNWQSKKKEKTLGFRHEGWFQQMAYSSAHTSWLDMKSHCHLKR